MTRAISDSTPITVRAILPVGCEHTSDLSASHPARRHLYGTEAECSLRDSVADRRLCPLPGSWATLAYMPALRPRRTHAPKPFQGRRWGLPRSRPRRLRHAPISELHPAACTLSVYASQPGSPPDHATLDSGWWLTLTGQVSHRLGRVEGFQLVCPFTSPSPLTKLRLAQREIALPDRVLPVGSRAGNMRVWSTRRSSVRGRSRLQADTIVPVLEHTGSTPLLSEPANGRSRSSKSLYMPVEETGAAAMKFRLRGPRA